MKHVGDITKLNGAELPIVDIITGGSPCQDLSVAGKRAGLAGERSGLFMEQIRIIKEMRDECFRQIQMRGTDEHIRPRFMVWENVPGAFSSNGGEDFRAVLEEVCRVADKNAVVPKPTRGGGKWSTSGCILGSGEHGVYSVAWRVHDAQFWGVPQRRKRIALVADFGGDAAPEILFEREGVRGDSAESREAREGIAGDTEEGAGETINVMQSDPVYCLQGNGIDRADTAGCNGKGWREDQSYTLNTIDRPAVAFSFDSLASNSMKSSNPHSGCREVDVSKCIDCANPDPSKNQGGIAIVQCKTFDQPVLMTQQAIGEYKQGGVASNLKQRDYKDATDLVIQ